VSGPVSALDTDPTVASDEARATTFELTPSRAAEVGGVAVRRALPRRARRTVGAWCFLDHFGPAPSGTGGRMQIGPHPHTGLQTVTWLLEGEVLHADSLGSTQLIRPGQLNLMSAGRGVAHAEQGQAGSAGGHGVQLWVAQPETTRNGPPGFEHHSELPTVELSTLRATVLLGELGGVRSTARTDTEIVGAELSTSGGGGEVPLAAAFEHAVVVLDGSLRVAGHDIAPGALAYLGSGRDVLSVQADGPTRSLLIGGRPFTEPLLMWWNFVARTHEEIDEMYRDWQSESQRFGPVRSPLARVPAPAPVWLKSS
jgi:redox-sensitive bicupin YhaK (pirin superfamily)